MRALLAVAAVLQILAVVYGVFLLSRREGAAGAWLFLLAAMLSMLAWRIVILTGLQPPPFFNPLIAIWGSTCMVAAMFLFGREVTMRKRLEAERDALLASERAARSHAERAGRLKDDFLATLSHELRTPLAAILGWCAVARGKRGDIERAIDVIERNARVQARLVEDLLDITRMHAGTLHLEFVPVPLDAPVRAALQAVRPDADAKSITIHFHSDAEVPHVMGDAGRLQQVASNLLVNAVKFTPAGGRIDVFTGTSQGFAQLRVTDTGEGIDPEFLPQLFTRFRQADSGPTRRHGGLGLGLSIVATLVRLHGGEVHGASDGRGKGSTFTVTFPLLASRDAGAEIAPASSKVPSIAHADALAGLRILIIDDEQDVRTAVSRILEQMGAQVIALESGRTVESVLLRDHPHVLLIDIGMPHEDGYTLMRRIRSLPTGAGGDTPAISLTAHARDEDRARALGCGFQHHLPKPIEIPVLVAAIRELAFSCAGAGKVAHG